MTIPASSGTFGQAKFLQTFRGHTGQIYDVSITPDGQRAISGSNDKTCILWDLRTGKALKTISGHAGRIYSVSITPDGQRAISGSWDKSCILWELGTGKKLACFVSDFSIYAVKFFPNGILLGGESGEVVILNINRNSLHPGTPITTTRQIWDFELQKYQELSADCQFCGHRFAPTASVLDTIRKITTKAGLRPEQSPCLELPDEAWEDPGLIGNCPQCGAELKFNPFIAGGDN
jgi:WD40 repeat protein